MWSSDHVALSKASHSLSTSSEGGRPVVTRFFWPPLMPRIMALPTFVSAHTCRARSASQTGCQAHSQQQSLTTPPSESAAWRNAGSCSASSKSQLWLMTSRAAAKEGGAAPAAHGGTYDHHNCAEPLTLRPTSQDWKVRSSMQHLRAAAPQKKQGWLGRTSRPSRRMTSSVTALELWPCTAAALR